LNARLITAVSEFDPLKILNKGKTAWNRWRNENPEEPIDLSTTNLANADLRGFDLRSVNLSYSNLHSADLCGIIRKGREHPTFSNAADLRGANLRGAILTSANLEGGRLRDANLSRANLAGANLRGAVLRDASLDDANLASADLTGVFLKKTHGLLQEQIESAIGDHSTKLPPHLTYPESWGQSKATTPQPAKSPAKLVPPANLSWEKGKISSIPRDRQSDAPPPNYRDSLVQAQSTISEHLASDVRNSNADRNIARILDRYSIETRKGPENLNPILLNSFSTTIFSLFARDADALGDINRAQFDTYFENHRVLGRCYPELEEFLVASKSASVFPDESGRAALLQVPSILSEAPAPEIIDESVVEIAFAEAEEPDEVSSEKSDQAVANKTKWYALTTLAARVYELLKAAPILERGIAAIETLLARLKPLWDLILSLTS
jgi:uncharacterized protein YjbI with pentapeptide repeats